MYACHHQEPEDFNVACYIMHVLGSGNMCMLIRSNCLHFLVEILIKLLFTLSKIMSPLWEPWLVPGWPILFPTHRSWQSQAMPTESGPLAVPWGGQRWGLSSRHFLLFFCFGSLYKGIVATFTVCLVSAQLQLSGRGKQCSEMMCLATVFGAIQVIWCNYEMVAVGSIHLSAVFLKALLTYLKKILWYLVWAN